MEKELSPRKQKILQAVVDEYITSAVPVSSGEIREKYLLDVSSATIRSELASLEDMGYLIQPHISAGRVPLPAAYRLYVEKCLNNRTLSNEEIAFIKSQFSDRMGKVEDIIRQTAKIISDVTNYTSVIVVKNFSEVTVNDIKLVPIGDETVLLILVTDRGVLKDKTIEVAANITASYIQSATSLLNKMFKGKTVAEILSPEGIINDEINEFKRIFDEVIEVIGSYDREGSNKVYMEGALKMLDYPECNNVADAKNFLSVISRPNEVAHLVNNADDIEFSVKIGRDDSGGIDKCAVVSAKYKFKGKEIGQAGVIGPDRMDYNKVISVLKYISLALEEVMDKDDK
ncbi:MAG: heat-inducible transcriptional repressor HrcA [Clostridia bacterium]